MQKQQEREKDLDCKRFCSYPINDILGISIQSQYLYIIQNTKISVYQYHGENDIPQLSEELIHNSIIENYCINKHYICISSSSLIEVRDRKHWENVIYTDNFNQTHEDIGSIILQEHFLFISKKENGHLVFFKIDVESKQVIASINLGKATQPSIQILKTIKPIFLNALGMLSDFYIWTKTSNKVQLGMLYTTGQGISRTKFQINQIEINDGTIKQVYHHRVNCVKYPHQSTEHVVIIVERGNKQLYLQLYEVVSKDHSFEKQKDEEKEEFQGKLRRIITQFSNLKKFNDPPSQNSLFQEVFSEAIANKAADKSNFQIKLEGLCNYQQSYMCEGKIWVVSQEKICEIELVSQQSVENIVRNHRIQQNILKSIIYHSKPKAKQFIGLYKSKQLFTQTTTSFDIVLNREGNDQIAEEIEEYEVNDQILEKQTQIRIAEAEKQIQDFIKLNLDEKEEEEQPQKQKMSDCIQADYCLQTEPIIKQSKQFATQTPPLQQKIIQKAVPIGLQSIQDLVAKYSSSVSVSCMKLKQNNYIKDKFDRQIFNIMDGLVKESVQPYLQSKFIAHLDQKIKDITMHISTVFQTQLEGLNQFVRKNQAKESNLRGRRIFQFSNQIKDIKQTVSIITDTLKANQIQKYAFNQLILEQAKQMKQEITKVSTSISQLDQKNQAYEKEISNQITEIFQLIKTLEEKHKQNLEDDSSCERESEEQSEQREIDETSEQQNLSVDSKQEFQREQMHYRYPPYNHYAVRGIQENKRNKKSLQSLDKKGYTPYPSPQFYHAPTQMPYYYPFVPQLPSLMHGYYPPNYSYTHTKQEGKSQIKKGKHSKKTKKVDE